MDALKELKIDKSQWTPIKFGDVAFEPKESVKDPQAECVEHVVGLEHIESENIHLTRSDNLEQSTTFTKKFAVGDMLFGRRRAYLKKAAQARFTGICSGDITVLRAKDNLLPKLLPFIVQNEKFFDYAIKHSAGGLSPRVKFKDLANFEFHLPPKSQQTQLAELLWATDEMLQKSYGLLGVHSKLVDSCRAETFKGNRWPQRRLNDFFEVQLGKMLSAKARTGDSPFPYLTNQNIQWGRIVLDKVNEMDFNIKEQEKFSLRPGDLLVCEGGEVGRSAIWQGEMAECFYQKALHRLRVIDDKYSPEVMLQFMFWANTQNIFKGLTGHSTIAHLTAVKLKEMKIPDIPKSDQVHIKKRFEELGSSREKIESKIKAVVTLQKSLIDKVF